jgi:hypothetical protein
VDNYTRTIWQGDDDFVNVCINELERLYPSGGRLHCFHREFDYSMKLLRKSVVALVGRDVQNGHLDGLPRIT